MRIRAATASDRTFLEAFAQAATAERGYDDLFGPVDWEMVTLGPEVIVLIAENPDPIGCFVAALVPHPLSGRLYADQMLWYVVPAHRNSSAGPKLLSTLERICLNRSVIPVLVKVPADRLRMGRHVEARGYRAIETSFVKDLTATDERSHLWRPKAT